jgi:hypothetical protein
MDGNLDTTNVMLAIIAVASAFEALLIIGLGVGAFLAYRRVMTLITDLEARLVAPAMARVNAVLDDVKDVSAKVKEEADRVDHAIRTTMERVDETADRFKSNVRLNKSRIVGAVRGARVAIDTILQGDGHESSPSAGPVRVVAFQADVEPADLSTHIRS